MGKRSEQERIERKGRDKANATAYVEYYSSNPDQVQRCSICGISKRLKEFLPTYAMRTRCRQCHREKTRQWRGTNKLASDASKSKSFQRSADLIRSFKERPCSRCGKEYPPHVLDFHHLRDKVRTVSGLYEKSPDRIREEIRKCDILCANCHRDETQESSRGKHVHKNRVKKPETVEVGVTDGCDVKKCGICLQSKNVLDFSVLKSGSTHTYCKVCLRKYNSKFTSGRPRSTSEAIKEAKDNKPCKDCGERFRYWVLDFDHVGEKTANVGRLRGGSLKRLLEEIGKCDLVCANCHRDRTYKARTSMPAVRSVDRVEPIRFELSRIRVVRCDDVRAAKSVLERHHYAKFGRPARAVYAAYLQDHMISVAKICPVVRKEVATSMGMDPESTVELDRLCVVPGYNAPNLISKFLSSVVKMVKRDMPEAASIMTFADPDKGHSGKAYEASNWKFVGLSPASYEYVTPEGETIHKKTVYNRAIREGMKEKEYSTKEGLSIRTLPQKRKYVMVIK